MPGNLFQNSPLTSVHANHFQNKIQPIFTLQAGFCQSASKHSIPAVASQIFRTEGVAGFLVGAPIRVGLTAPNLGVLLLVVELLSRMRESSWWNQFDRLSHVAGESLSDDSY